MRVQQDGKRADDECYEQPDEDLALDKFFYDVWTAGEFTDILFSE